MNKLLLIGLFLFITACASSKNQNYVEHLQRTSDIAPGSTLLVKVNAEAPIDFYGEVDLDNVNADHGQMLYAAPTPGVFAASILAHAVIAGSVNDNQKAKAQEEANKVLLPYADAITQLTEENLILGALESPEFSAYSYTRWTQESDSIWSLVSKPVFLMSQDQRTLTLKNAITLIANNQEEAPAYQNLIEVVSLSSDTETGIAAEYLSAAAAELFATSLVILEAELQGKHADKSNQQTLSYLHGGKKQFERGVVLSEQCNRMTYRSLRGWIKSVPKGGDAGSCEVALEEREEIEQI